MVPLLIIAFVFSLITTIITMAVGLNILTALLWLALVLVFFGPVIVIKIQMEHPQELEGLLFPALTILAGIGLYVLGLLLLFGKLVQI